MVFEWLRRWKRCNGIFLEGDYGYLLFGRLPSTAFCNGEREMGVSFYTFDTFLTISQTWKVLSHGIKESDWRLFLRDSWNLDEYRPQYD